MSIEQILLILPFVLLLLYSVFNVISRRTKSTVDDKVAEVLGEVLEGLGRVRPENRELEKRPDESADNKSTKADDK